MHIEYLLFFMDIADAKSIAEVARKHQITPQGMSRVIRKLEIELRTPLIKRTSNSMRLSPAGERLIPYIKDVVAQYEKLRNAAILEESGVLEDDSWRVQMYLHRMVSQYVLNYHEVLSRLFPDDFFDNHERGSVDQIFDEVLLSPDTSIGIVPYNEYYDYSSFNKEELEERGLRYIPWLSTYEMLLISASSPYATQLPLSRADMKKLPIICSSSTLDQIAAILFDNSHQFKHVGDSTLRYKLIKYDKAASLTPAIFGLLGASKDMVLVPFEDTYAIEIGLIGTTAAFNNPNIRVLLDTISNYFKSKEPSELFTMHHLPWD
jgi:DNA-binding transcriptional LysR family regulator